MKAIYRCRLCGKEFSTDEEIHYKTAYEAIGVLTYKENYNSFTRTISRYNYHTHPDNSVGFADFIGFKL
jgi:hypothetical protein